MKIQTITEAERRAEEVARWGEAAVAATEADVARRFAHLNHQAHTVPNADCRKCAAKAEGISIREYEARILAGVR